MEFRRMGERDDARRRGVLTFRQVLIHMEKTRAFAGPAGGMIASRLAHPSSSQSAMAKKSPARPPLKERAMPPNPPSAPSKELHVFPTRRRARLRHQFQVPEFTCHCPLTGQPDFAHFTIDMIADELCVELKSLKMLLSYRNEGAFHEKVTNTILDDIVKATAPRFIRITAKGTCAAASTPTWWPSTARRVGSRSRWCSCSAHAAETGLLRTRCSASCTPTRSNALRELTRGITPNPASSPSPGHRRAQARHAGADQARADGQPRWLSQLPGHGRRARCARPAPPGQRRYGVTLDAATQVLPVIGSREALFAGADGDRSDPARRHGRRPNPFYQIYEGAALLAGAQPHYANSDPARNFAVDWASVPDEVWARTQLYVCSPGNPTGAVMPLAEWKTLFELSDATAS